MPGHALGLVGPGPGLGVSGLLPGGEAGRVDRTGGTALWLPLHGEGGHVTLAAQGAREHAVLAELERRHGHVSAERVVSGQGLANLYSALARMDSPGAPELRLSAADITERALLGDASCGEALDLFCAFLGSVAGNLALTLGAQGGVYIGGGMVPRFLDWFVQSPFRQRFEAKGRFSAYLATVPVFVIVARQSPALRGAACALDLQG